MSVTLQPGLSAETRKAITLHTCGMCPSIDTAFLVFILSVTLQPGLSAETRKAIGEAAVRAARAVNYVGAGEYLG